MNSWAQTDIDPAAAPSAPAAPGGQSPSPDVQPAQPAMAIAPGSSDGPGGGGPVHELAQLLEQLGEKTYLTDGGNPDHVFDDDLMAAVRRVLTNHALDTTEQDAIARVQREIAILNEITGDVWQTLRTLAAKAQGSTTSATSTEAPASS